MRWLWLAAIAMVACAVAVASAAGSDRDSGSVGAHVTVLPRLTPGRDAVTVQVSGRTVGRPIQRGFVGLSLEYSTIEAYAGTDPSAIDPVVVQLIRNLSPGAPPVLRIGGDSTDWAWWPVPHRARPAGIRIVLGPRFGAVLGGLSRALGARLILGINLEADSRRIATYEATQLIRRVGPRSVLALELGNEPELYGSWPWFVAPDGRRVLGRAVGYGMAAYVQDFRRIVRGLPPVGLAGPTLGGPLWIRRLGEFVDGVPGLTLVTVHTYPLQHCFTPLVSPTYPTIGHLLSLTASEGLAARLAPAVRIAHAHGLPLRVDEINSVSCGGAPGISNSFASALWALDTMFAMAGHGVDGVNIHTFEDATYRLFRMELRDGRWRGIVAPEYYGLLLFAQAAPAGARLLEVSGGGGHVRVWATRARGGTVHVVLMNDGTRPQLIAVRGLARATPAAYEALRAPGLGATHGVSLGGVGFGPSTETGILPAPRRMLARPENGVYVLRIPGASAAMLSMPPGRPSRGAA